MDKIIITIRDKKKRFNGYDLEVPTNVPVRQLKKDIVETLNSYKKRLSLSDKNVQLSSVNLKRMLRDSETFESAGVWTGDYIEFDS